MNFLNPKLIIIFAFIVIIFAGITLLVLSTNKKGLPTPPSSSQPTSTINPLPNNSTNPGPPLHVVSITPSKSTILTPDQNQTFTIKFDNFVNLSNLDIRLSQFNFQTNSAPQAVEFNSQVSPDGKIVNITTKATISANNQYSLTIKDLNGNSLLQVNYTSDRPLPTKIPTNNQALIPFLPHETDTYSLNYTQDQNLYVFNLKLDSNSPDDAQTQFDKAKADAINFIQSKNIDVSTLVIDWRYF